MEDLHYLLELTRTYGYWVVGIGIFLECMGVPFPGETVLILGAVSASLGYMNLPLVIILASIAAITGDNIGYFLGKKYGRKLIKKFEHFPLFHYKHIDRAERFFKAHGNKTVFIGRFTAVLRTYAAVFAGVFDMPYSTFFFYNMTGGVIWATAMGIIGFIIGDHLELLGQILTDFQLFFLAIVLGFIGYKIIKILHRKHVASKTKSP